MAVNATVTSNESVAVSGTASAGGRTIPGPGDFGGVRGKAGRSSLFENKIRAAAAGVAAGALPISAMGMCAMRKARRQARMPACSPAALSTSPYLSAPSGHAH